MGFKSFFEGAAVVIMRLGVAVFAAIADEAVGKIKPFFFGEQFHEILLYFFWVCVFAEAEFL